MSNRAWQRRRSNRWVRQNHQWVKLVSLREFVDALYLRVFPIPPEYTDPDNYELVK